MASLRIGIIGAGGAARGIHIPGLKLCPGVELAVCDMNPDAARGSGIDDVCGSVDEMLSRDDIQAIVNATPNHLHRDIVIQAAARGKHILCEKPLALNVDQAKEMLDAAERAGVVHMTAFTYRFTPALQYIKHLIDGGELGTIRTVRAAYLMALSTHLLGWRSTKAQAGSGVLADIGSHLIHMTTFLAGDIDALTAISRDMRKDPTSDVEDWISFLAEFESGAVGTFEISRVCPGRGAGITEEIFLEVYGSDGSAVFSLQDPWAVRVALGDAGRDPKQVMEHRQVPEEFLKRPGSPRDVWVDDRRWGYRFDQEFQFVESIRAGRSEAPTLADGVCCQAVLDAALESSRTRGWVKVPR